LTLREPQGTRQPINPTTNQPVNQSTYRENSRLLVTKEGSERSIHPSRLSAIHIFTPCSLSSPVVVWASTHQIMLLFYDRKGKVVARLWEPHFGSHAGIRLAQLSFCQSPEGFIMVKEWLLAKVVAQKVLHDSFKTSNHHQKISDKMDRLIIKL